MDLSLFGLFIDVPLILDFKQEVLGSIDRQLSLIRHGRHRKQRVIANVT
jgi:hypothetical protein